MVMVCSSATRQGRGGVLQEIPPHSRSWIQLCPNELGLLVGYDGDGNFASVVVERQFVNERSNDFQHKLLAATMAALTTIKG